MYTRRAALAASFAPLMKAAPRNLPDGLWPVMLTPFKTDKSIDYNALDALTDWYIANGADGLFACCMSSEVFHLTPEERLEVTRRVVKRAGKVPVVAAGMPSRQHGEALPFISKMMDTGIDSFVIITNQMAEPAESDTLWLERTEALLAAAPGIRMGFYEAPSPYKRLLSIEMLRWAGKTGRFFFLKDVSLDAQVIGERAKAVAGTPLKVFNAHAAIMLDAVAAGGHGFSGVCANGYPGLVSLGLKRKSQQIQEFMRENERTIGHKYPTSCKVLANLAGVPMAPVSRRRDVTFTDEEMEKLRALRRSADGLQRSLA
jgi:4-hydroxy-tetrahydrodipicolinate synthase